MAEVVYTEGYNIMSNLGKGKALLAMNVTCASASETITTPFTRCVPVVTASVAADNTSIFKISQAAGVVTIACAGTAATEYQALILGDLY